MGMAYWHAQCFHNQSRIETINSMSLWRRDCILNWSHYQMVKSSKATRWHSNWGKKSAKDNELDNDAYPIIQARDITESISAVKGDPAKKDLVSSWKAPKRDNNQLFSSCLNLVFKPTKRISDIMHGQRTSNLWIYLQSFNFSETGL